jgi:signal transduction histidine kinase
VELHNGWVEIESGSAGGTLVRCHIPRRIHDGKPPPMGTNLTAA